MKEPRVGALIVNWNRREDLERCLMSLRLSVTNPPVDLRLFVVDNASHDGSAEMVREAFPDVTLLANDRNLGFAEGNNVGLRHIMAAGSDYILLINNDATVDRDTIAQLLVPLLSDEQVGVSGPALCYLADPEHLWSAGGTIDWHSGEVTNPYLDQPVGALPRCCFTVDYVSGCCMLVRASAIAAAGLFDPLFFMYYEETEWCARIAKRGFRLVVNPCARAWHDISPQTQEGSPAIAYYMTRNHLLFLRATKAPPTAWIFTIGRQIRTVASLFLTTQSPERIRGRLPMLLAMRDFALGRFGPTTLPRLLR